MKKNLDITKPRYSEQILSVTWPFVISRFHCLYHYMRYFCNLIGLEQWYFSLNLIYLHVKITNLLRVWYNI